MYAKENTSDEWDIPRYIRRRLCITILYHVIENAWPYTINVVHGGKDGGLNQRSLAHVTRRPCWWSVEILNHYCRNPKVTAPLVSDLAG